MSHWRVSGGVVGRVGVGWREVVPGVGVGGDGRGVAGVGVGGVTSGPSAAAARRGGWVPAAGVRVGVGVAVGRGRRVVG